MNTAGKIIQNAVWQGIQIGILRTHRLNDLKDAQEKGEFTVGSYTGLLGVPVIENVRLKSVDGNVDLLLPDALCVVTMSKNIIKTPLQGRSGTVKEYITDGDYQVTVNGTITDPTPDTFPEAEVGQLIHLCQLPEAVDVVSEFLQGLGIFQLVVESYNLNQESGYINRQKYSLKCLSDQPLELTVDN